MGVISLLSLNLKLSQTLLGDGVSPNDLFTESLTNSSNQDNTYLCIACRFCVDEQPSRQ